MTGIVPPLLPVANLPALAARTQPGDGGPAQRFALPGAQQPAPGTYAGVIRSDPVSGHVLFVGQGLKLVLPPAVVANPAVPIPAVLRVLPERRDGAVLAQVLPQTAHAAPPAAAALAFPAPIAAAKPPRARPGPPAAPPAAGRTAAAPSIAPLPSAGRPTDGAATAPVPPVPGPPVRHPGPTVPPAAPAPAAPAVGSAAPATGPPAPAATPATVATAVASASSPLATPPPATPPPAIPPPATAPSVALPAGSALAGGSPPVAAPSAAVVSSPNSGPPTVVAQPATPAAGLPSVAPAVAAPPLQSAAGAASVPSPAPTPQPAPALTTTSPSWQPGGWPAAAPSVPQAPAGGVAAKPVAFAPPLLRLAAAPPEAVRVAERLAGLAGIGAGRLGEGAGLKLPALVDGLPVSVPAAVFMPKDGPLHRLVLGVGEEAPDGQAGPQRRLVLEVDLEHLGRVRLDGLADSGRFDILMANVPDAVRPGLRALWSLVAQRTGLVGDLTFHDPARRSDAP